MAPLDDETAKKVIRQVEFYFSDSNLPRDNFMMKTISESDDGMVSLTLICSFSRMRGHLSLGDVKPEDVTEDTIQAVAETLKTSTFLKVSEDGKNVGRVTELTKPDEVIKQSDDRTVAASPLEYDIKLEHVESFFSQYAKVNSVRLPRHVSDNRLFCGTALIEYANVEDAASVLKQTLSFSGTELELKPKEEFDAERAKQEEEVAKTRPQLSSNRKERTNAQSDSDYPKGLIVAFTLKSLFAGGSTKQNGNDKQMSDNIDDAKKNDNPDKTLVDSEDTVKEISEDPKDDSEDAENAEKCEEKDVDPKVNDADKSVDITSEKEGHDSGEERPVIAACKNNKDVVLREDLKSIFQKFGTVKFIDFKIGLESGYIRFEEAEAAQKARTAAVLAENNGLIVKNFIAVLEPVTGCLNDVVSLVKVMLRRTTGMHSAVVNKRDIVEGEEVGKTVEAVGILVGSIRVVETINLDEGTKFKKLEQHELYIIPLK